MQVLILNQELMTMFPFESKTSNAVQSLCVYSYYMTSFVSRRDESNSEI